MSKQLDALNVAIDDLVNADEVTYDQDKNEYLVQADQILVRIRLNLSDEWAAHTECGTRLSGSPASGRLGQVLAWALL